MVLEIAGKAEIMVRGQKKFVAYYRVSPISKASVAWAWKPRRAVEAFVRSS